MSDKQLLWVLTTLIYEGKPADSFKIKGVSTSKVVSVLSKAKDVLKAVNLHKLKRLFFLTHLWYEGREFD
mgnify:CR=1 FL=1